LPGGSKVINNNFKIVAFAASLGGIEALKQILSSLPIDFPAAVVVVQHRTVDKPFRLPQVLGKNTELKIIEAVRDADLQPGVVLVAPPGLHMLVQEEGRIQFSDAPKVNFVRPSADVLFSSLAKYFGPRVIAIVLTGIDGDGSNGAAIVSEMGGIVIVQDPDSARAPGMPRSTIRTGAVDFVLPLKDIAPCLMRLVAKADG
jgi:two-component system chemotaxis response regulator CheB